MCARFFWQPRYIAQTEKKRFFSFINKYLLTAYYVPSILLGDGDTQVNKTNILASVEPMFKCGKGTGN